MKAKRVMAMVLAAALEVSSFAGSGVTAYAERMFPEG